MKWFDQKVLDWICNPTYMAILSHLKYNTEGETMFQIMDALPNITHSETRVALDEMERIGLLYTGAYNKLSATVIGRFAYGTYLVAGNKDNDSHGG